MSSDSSSTPAAEGPQASRGPPDVSNGGPPSISAASEAPTGNPESSGVSPSAEAAATAAATAADDTQVYLQALRNMQRAPTMKLGLKGIEDVAQALGNPHTKFTAVHVAGTNGKGSVCTKIAACLMAKGHRVGVFQSPHLLSLRERFTINGVPISEHRFAECQAAVSSAAAAANTEVTFFECCTLMAFLYFAMEEVQWAVVETGLGGRLDATNILRDTRCCVISSIGWDHMEILGDSLESIAEEKAGIIKPKSQVVLGPSAAPFSVFWARAAELQCDVWEVKPEPRGEDFDTENGRIAALVAQSVLGLDLTAPQLATALKAKPPMRACWLSQQQLRAAANLCSSSSIKGPAAAADGAGETKLPLGVVVDVGHNESAVDRLLQVVGYRHYGCPVRVLVCVSGDRTPDILRPITAQLMFPKNNRLVGLHLASADHHRCRGAIAVYEKIKGDSRYATDLLPAVEAGVRDSCCWLSPETPSADADPEELFKRITKGTLPQLLRGAFAAAAAEGSILVICGSFFMMREVLQTLGLAEGPVDPDDMNERSPTKP